MNKDQCNVQRAKRRLLHRLFALCTLHVALTFAVSLSYASGEADAFALNGVGARSGGMGGAFIGLADDLETVYYNPAGLGTLKRSGFTTMYQTPSLQTSKGFLAVNRAWDHPLIPGSVALGWLRLQSKDIELTNTSEQILGTDTLTNDLLLLGVGVQPFDHISVGATLKYIRFAFDGFKESGVGYDMGVHGQYDWFKFGAVFTDLDGTTLHGASIDPSRPDVSDTVPFRFRPGIAVSLDHPLGLPVDVNCDIDELIKLHDAQETRLFMGLELWGFQKHAAFRSGYQEGFGPTLGLGLRYGRIQLDYAYLMSLALQNENRLGLGMTF